MGCIASAVQEHNESTATDMMARMQQQMVNMQEQQLAKQQQMVRDDPECKEILDQHTSIQQKMLVAMQAGDQAGQAQAQKESMELYKNPKYMKMMMPDVPHITMGFEGMGRMGNPSVTTTTTKKTGVLGKRTGKRSFATATKNRTTTTHFTSSSTGIQSTPILSDNLASTDPSSMFTVMSQSMNNNMWSSGHGDTGASSGGGFASSGGDFGSSY
jgi:uncharacterized membrane protein YgcG